MGSEIRPIVEFECPHCVTRYTDFDSASHCCMRVDVYHKCPLCDWESLDKDDFFEHVEESHKEAQSSDERDQIQSVA